MILSPTQIETYLSCPRKWALSYVQKIRPPQAASAARGEAIHLIIERHIKGLDPLADASWKANIAPEEATVAEALLKLAIEEGYAYPSPEVLVEEPIRLELGTHAVVGKVDWHHPQSRKIRDWKTTKDFKWATKDAKSLWQTKIYCVDFAERFGPGEITMEYVYLRAVEGKEKIKVVSVTATDADIELWKAELTAIVAKMAETAALSEAAQDAQSPSSDDACEKYGGCAFAPFCCQLKTKEEIKEAFKMNPVANRMVQATPAAVVPTFGNKPATTAPAPVIEVAAPAPAPAVEIIPVNPLATFLDSVPEATTADIAAEPAVEVEPVVEPVKHDFKVGQSVVGTARSFKGRKGKITGVEKDHLWVLFDGNSKRSNVAFGEVADAPVEVEAPRYDASTEGEPTTVEELHKDIAAEVFADQAPHQCEHDLLITVNCGVNTPDAIYGKEAINSLLYGFGTTLTSYMALNAFERRDKLMLIPFDCKAVLAPTLIHVLGDSPDEKALVAAIGRQAVVIQASR